MPVVLRVLICACRSTHSGCSDQRERLLSSDLRRSVVCSSARYRSRSPCWSFRSAKVRIPKRRRMAVFPFVVLLNGHFPDLETYRDSHEAVYFTVVSLFTVGVGVFISDLGSFIELAIDSRLSKKFPEMQDEWEAYLRKTYNSNSEPVGQRYLRAVLLHLKFELSLAIALIPYYIGMVLVNDQRGWFSCSFITGLGIILFLFFCFLLYSAYTFSRLLLRIRKNLLKS